MSNAVANLILRLVDDVSGPAKGVADSLMNIGTATSKASLRDRRANLLSPEGGALAVARMKALDKSTAAFSRRYEVAAIQTGRTWSSNLAATSAAIAAQGKAHEAMAKRGEAANKRLSASAMAAAAVHHRATISPGGPMYRLGQPPRPPLGTGAPLPPLAGPSTSGKQRASDWVTGRAGAAAAAAAAAAARGGDGDHDGPRIRPGVGGAIGGGSSIAAVWAVMKKRAEEERSMRLSAIAAGVPESEIPKKIAELRSIQDELRMPYDKLKEGFDELLTLGKTWEEATQGLRTIARASLAYKDSTIKDFARLQFSLGDNFGLKTPDQQRRGLEITAGFGRIGRFEASDYSSRMPSLGPRFAAAGLRGEEGVSLASAILQRIRTRTGTSAEAATRAERLLDEVNSPQAAKRFKAAGIDLEKELKDGTAAGRSRIETYLDALRRATGGDENLVARYIPNTYARQAGQALLDLQELQKTLAEGKKAAEATLSGDSDRVIADNKSKIDALGFAMSDLGSSLGQAATKLTPWVERFSQAVRKLSGETPASTDKGGTGGAGTIAGAAAGGAIALGAAKMGLRFVPGIGWLVSAGALASGLYYGENNVAPGDAADRQNAVNAIGRKWRRPDPTKRPRNLLTSFPSIGSRGGLQLGVPGVLPRGDVNNWTSPSTAPMPPMRPPGLDAASAAYDAILRKIDEVNSKATRPEIDPSEIQKLIALISSADAGLDRLGQRARSIANQTAKTLKPGGEVRRTIRGIQADTGE